MNDWLILEKFEYYDVLKFKEIIDTAIIQNNIQSVTCEKSTTGINSQQYDLMNCLMSISDVRFKVQNKVELALKQNNVINENSRLNIKSAWTVLGFENCFHTIHKHNLKCEANHVSTVTYLNLPENDKNRPGSFYAILKDNLGENTDFNHDPQFGEIIIFPVWVYHGTYPQGRGLRQTLNMDFEVI
jgi:hypothetical protein